MKNLKLAVVGICFAASATAGAVNFEAGIGASLYKDSGTGLWYDDGFQHKLKLAAPTFELGVTGNLIQRRSWGLDWHADWAYLGVVHTDAMIPTPSTNTASGKWVGSDFIGANVSNPCKGPCTNMSRLVGNGHDQGILLTLEPHYDVNNWRFSFEFGPYIHRSTWNENCYNLVYYPGGTPFNTGMHNDGKWERGSVIGASLGYRNFTVSYQYFDNKTKNETYPPIWRSTQMLTLNYKF